MIERLMNLNHFTYKKPFSGSDKGNKFKYIIQMIMEELPSEDVNALGNDSDTEKKEPEKVRMFKVTCWMGENNSVVTPDEEKKVRKFDFSESGYDEAIKWLNEESDKIEG